MSALGWFCPGQRQSQTEGQFTWCGFDFASLRWLWQHRRAAESPGQELRRVIWLPPGRIDRKGKRELEAVSKPQPWLSHRGSGQRLGIHTSDTGHGMKLGQATSLLLLLRDSYFPQGSGS